MINEITRISASVADAGSIRRPRSTGTCDRTVLIAGDRDPEAYHNFGLLERKRDPLTQGNTLMLFTYNGLQNGPRSALPHGRTRHNTEFSTTKQSRGQSGGTREEELGNL